VTMFRLNRKVDASGVSGTGIVAEGAMFGDGSVAIRWRGDTTSVGVNGWALYESFDDAVRVHGHGGKTLFEVVDETPIGA